jgi:hypothetical protein
LYPAAPWTVACSAIHIHGVCNRPAAYDDGEKSTPVTTNYFGQRGQTQTRSQIAEQSNDRYRLWYHHRG